MIILTMLGKGDYRHPVTFVIRDWKTALEIIGEIWLKPIDDHRWFVQTTFGVGVGQ